MSSLTIDDRGVIVSCGSCGRLNRLPYDRLGQNVRCGQCHTDLAAPAAPVPADSSAHFDRLVGASSLPVLVDFWAAWCGPCRMVAPEIEKIARHRAGQWLVVKVDTEAVPDLSSRLGIRSIPMLAVYHHGRERARQAGAMPGPQIEAFVDAALRQ